MLQIISKIHLLASKHINFMFQRDLKQHWGRLRDDLTKYLKYTKNNGHEMNNRLIMSVTNIKLPALTTESDISAYIKSIAVFPLLEPEEEKILSYKLRDTGDVKAAERLVTSHLRLVVKIAYSYKNYGLSMMDIISEGNIGLMRAVKKFDVTKGFRLSTYAMWWIKAQIQEYVLRSWSMVKIGTTVAQKKLFFNLNKLKNKILSYEKQYLAQEDVKLISNELGVTEAEVNEMSSRLDCGDIYLYDQVGGDSDAPCLIDNLASDAESQEDLYANQQEREANLAMLKQAVNCLNEREEYIINNRKLSYNPRTLEDLSVEFKVSKERIRQIEARALEKIKEYFNNK
jgi:RNA polymerase sigma-32 factor